MADFGTRGSHLAYQLLDGYDTLILIDTMARGKAPGTLYVFEPDPADVGSESVDAHGLDRAAVLSMVRLLGGTIGRTIVVGCEPAEIVERVGLRAPVALAVEEAVELVCRLVVSPGQDSTDSAKEDLR